MREIALLLVLMMISAQVVAADASLAPVIASETHAYTPPAIGKHHNKSPPFPWQQTLYILKEGWVVVGICIQPDGTVVDPVVTRSSGIPEFDKVTLEAVRGWRYEPATRDGAPIQECTTVSVNFRQGDLPLGASIEFAHRWRTANALIAKGAMPEAIAAVAALKPSNNYESARAAILSAALARAANDLATELRWIYDALAVPHALEKSAERTLMHMRFGDEMKLGRYADAFKSLVAIEKTGDSSLSDAERKAGEQLRSFVSGNQTIATDGLISRECARDSCQPAWGVLLLRHEFGLVGAAGSLERIELRCQHRQYLSAYTADLTWKVPESWGECTLFVFGPEGAHVRLVEYADTAPAHN